MTLSDPLNAFASAADFLRRLAEMDDSRLYPMADAIRRMPDMWQKIDGYVATIGEMRRLGLVDDTLHLTEVGRAIWCHLHS